MPRGIKLRWIAVVAAFGLLGGGAATLAGCSFGSGDDFASAQDVSMVQPAPLTFGGGAVWCAYVYTPLECQYSGIPQRLWVPFPTSYPTYADPYYNRDLQLFDYLTEWSPYYDSPSYVTRYVPARYQSDYTNRLDGFDQRYNSYVRKAHKKYLKDVRWRAPNGQVLTSTQVEKGNYTVRANNGVRTRLCAYVIGGDGATTATLVAHVDRPQPAVQATSSPRPKPTSTKTSIRKRISSIFGGGKTPTPTATRTPVNSRGSGHKSDYSGVSSC